MPDSLKFRTTAVDLVVESTKGWVWGAAGSGNRPAASQGLYSGRKERLRTNPQTTDRDPDRYDWLTRQDQPTAQIPKAHRKWRPGGSAPQTPRDLSLSCRARREKQKRDAQGIPSPISAPESALGSRLRVALSSAQVIRHSTREKNAEPLVVRVAFEKDLQNPIQVNLTTHTLSGRATRTAELSRVPRPQSVAPLRGVRAMTRGGSENSRLRIGGEGGPGGDDLGQSF